VQVNYIDIIVIMIIILGLSIGYFVSFRTILVFLTKWISSSMGSIFFYQHTKSFLNTYFLIKEDVQNLIAFVITFLIIYFSLSLIINWLSNRYKPSQNHLVLNKIGSLCCGGIVGFTLSFLVYSIIAASLWKDGAEKTQLSFSKNVFDPIHEYTAPYLPDLFFLDNSKNETVAGVSESSLALNYADEFKSSSFKENIIYEDKLLELVNMERKTRNLKILVKDSSLKVAAKLHCTDLFTRGYFSHNNPEGLTPFNRLEKLNIRYTTAGENLAFSSSVLAAHKALMNSPGHRANILNPKYGKIGISILENVEAQLMVVQEFKN
jgi:uncharacterized protein YkwD